MKSFTQNVTFDAAVLVGEDGEIVVGVDDGDGCGQRLELGLFH